MSYSFAKSPTAEEDYSDFITDTSSIARGVIPQVTDVPEIYTLHVINNKLIDANDFNT